MRRNFVVASIALAAVCLFASCNGNGNSKNAMASDDTAVERTVSSQIAYVNMDSLLTNYDLFVELSSELEEKAKKAENDILSRRRSLERSITEANEKVEKGLVTRSQMAQLQEDIQKKEQSYMQFSENIQMELAEENQVMMNRIFHGIDTFIKEFNSDYRYGMILTSSGSNPVLHADPALDITDIVIKGLNEAYAKEK